MARDLEVESDVSVSPVNENLYLVKYINGEKDIFFFSSQDELNSMTFTATFSSNRKIPWVWDPHTGERFIYPAGNKGELTIRLQALESILIVLEDDDKGEPLDLGYPDENTFMSIDAEWKMDFFPVHGEHFEMKSDRFFELGTHSDKRISAFAGQVSYQTIFNLAGTDWAFLDLGIEKHVTEVKLNGQELGVRWSGRHLYRIDHGILKEGENSLEITYTTTLANYVNSLSGNAVAKRWINLQEPDPMGLMNDVKLMKQE